jgi:O-antigen/teichoic acid export membrane protein
LDQSLPNIKDKTVKGLFWSFVDSFFGQGLQFVFGIILARILSPREFGLIGLLTFFLVIAQTIVDSGFTSALIRKTKCTQDDYSTVFYFNVLGSLFLYILLFFSSKSIASFYNEPQIEFLLKVMGLSIVINAFSIVQRTILTKNINFKLQTKISVLASIISGPLAIWMAMMGFGVWSLVGLALSRFFVTTVLLWILMNWIPALTFSKKSFNELFSYGSKLLLSGLINTSFTNIYTLIIGKYFSVIHLGYYTRAKQFTDLPSMNMNSIIGRVTFPVLSTLQDDKIEFKKKFQRIVKVSMFISFTLMFGLAAVAEPLVITLIGEKWRPIIIYLQLLCFAGSLYPLHSLNLSILKIFGRSDLFLRLEIIKIFLIIPFVYVGIKFGLTYLIIGQLATSVIAYFFNSYWSKSIINYSSLEQLMNILPSFILATIIGAIIFIIGNILNTEPFLKLCIQLTVGVLLSLLVGEISKNSEYLFLKTTILQYVKV